MYFSNIGNEELQHFHNTLGADFSMGLTDIISSKLFNVEEIITDTLYRIYPLFYCKEIISSNTNDEILDTRCIIAEKKTHETYFSFITTEDKSNIIIDETVFKTHNIDYDLTTDEFNALVYILRQKGILAGSIDFEETDQVTGVYGVYELNENQQLRNDTGFIVNNKIKNNPLTVTLRNPFFLNAKYTLTFTVRSLTGANVCLDEYMDYKTTDTFSIELIKDTPVALNVTDYINDSVIDFKVGVQLSFDTPEISNKEFGLTLTSEKNTYYLDETVNLKATLTSQGAVANYLVQFYEDNVLIGADSTGSTGEAIINYSPETLGDKIYSCQVLGLTGNIPVRIIKHSADITLTTDKSTAFIPTNFTVSGVLENEDGGIYDASVKIYDNNNLVDTVTTDSNGAFNTTITAEAVHSYSLKAVFEETSNIIGAVSNMVNVNARKLKNGLSINLNKTVMNCYESAQITGVLTDELNQKVNNAEIKIYNGNTLIASGTTNNQGAYTINHTFETPGTFNLVARYAGDGTHNQANSTIKTLTVNKATVTMTVSPVKTAYNPNDNINIVLSSNYGTFTADKILIDDTEITGTGNSFNYKVKPQADETFNIIFNGGANYESITRNYDVDNYLDAIVLSKSNGKLIIEAYIEYDPDDATPASFYDLQGLKLYFNNGMTVELPDGTITNGWGEFLMDYPPNAATVYAVYGNMQSNTLRL